MKRKFCLANFNALDTGVLKDLLVFILQKTTPLGALLLLLLDMPDKNVMKLKPVWGPWLSKIPT